MADVGPGTVLAGRYRLEHRLGQGGMGTVWAATQVGLGARFALKLMDAELARSELGRQRFEREARMLATLRTPHVVQVFDHGVHDDVPFLVMEVLEGEDLLVRLKRTRTLSLRELEPIVVQIAKGLTKAHEAGLVHRDLKPANVFLVEDDGHDLVKILDFGIAKSTTVPNEETVTSTGDVIGSPHYMSPEQARGLRRVDHRSDLWSVGVIAFRALTGARPFDGEGTGDVLVRICTAPLPLASEVAPGLPPIVDGFFARALAREPEDRFSSARELADAFSAMVARAGRVGAVPHPPPSAGSRQMAVPTSIDGSAPTGPSGTSVVRPFSNSAAPSKPLVPALEVKDVTTQAPIATGPGRRERSSKAWVIAGALMVGALGGAGLFAMTMAQPDESTRDTSAEKPTVAAELTATRPEQGAAGEIQSPAPVASAAPITAGAMATTSASAVQKTSAPVRAPTNGPKRAAQPAATAVAAPCKANDMFGIPCGSSK